MENTKSMRHRRTKAEMKLAREIEANEKTDDKPKQKRHRRTKVEMELVREDKTENTEELNVVPEQKIQIKNETVKLKYDLNGIPKDTILNVIDTPTNQLDDSFYIWVEYNGIKKKILKFSVFYVR
jgi:hypothetical protein